ncbi:hypothetical protein [Paenibacillus ehimensis]|uniref:Uncharacterized protein n=2 Tax=Paenibacillus ehimensis TaxID=79264 RepID=A0ABT8VML8_9BACL|nr:hypothetical protein [Paenibacillus ehimensis]MDO3682226.1 hypothetical protein [Paenibacillus ehimensis]MEC0211863.1 hypothetical protein [Paenibacillus ehimensis]
MKYAIKHQVTGEYLRDDPETHDAYTDDLGHAKLFDSAHDAGLEMMADEIVVVIQEDEDGGIWEDGGEQG